jgi:hypothetical protein
LALLAVLALGAATGLELPGLVLDAFGLVELVVVFGLLVLRLPGAAGLLGPLLALVPVVAGFVGEPVERFAAGVAPSFLSRYAWVFASLALR